MVVYVEYVFIDNFIIDLLLILLTRKSLKLSIKKLRVIVSALFGATVAVITPLFNFSTAICFALKMPIGLIIVLLSGKFHNFKEYVYCFYLFLFFTFASGGGVMAIFWALGLKFDALNFYYERQIPLSVSLIGVCIVYFLVKKLINKFYKRRKILNFTYKCQFTLGGKDFEFEGFLDSGNSLSYGNGKYPVVVCSKETAEKLKQAGVLAETQKDVMIINTVAGKTLLSVYKTQKFLIYNGLIPNILYNVMLGISTRDVLFFEYDILLNSSMVGDSYV